jgi:hypothetical protein
MRGPASVVLLAVWLLGGCDTVKRARDAEAAAFNCVEIAELSYELCEPDDPTTVRVFCGWTRRAPPIGLQPNYAMYYAEPAEALWSCDAALEVAIKECERGSTANGYTNIGTPTFNGDYCSPEMDPLVEPDCFTWFICE